MSKSPRTIWLVLPPRIPLRPEQLVIEEEPDEPRPRSSRSDDSDENLSEERFAEMVYHVVFSAHYPRVGDEAKRESAVKKYGRRYDEYGDPVLDEDGSLIGPTRGEVNQFIARLGKLEDNNNNLLGPSSLREEFRHKIDTVQPLTLF